MIEILAKRISSFLNRNHKDRPEATYSIESQYKALFNIVFSETMNWGGERKDFHEPILIYSNRRPRWMGQLCRMAGKKAFDDNSSVISERHIISVLSDFGKSRVSDLVKEHQHQFKYITKLVDVFRAGGRNYKLNTLEKVIQDKFVKKFGSTLEDIDGEPYIEVFQLGKFLLTRHQLSRTTPRGHHQRHRRFFGGGSNF